jgi:hypothetical protein
VAGMSHTILCYLFLINDRTPSRVILDSVNLIFLLKKLHFVGHLLRFFLFFFLLNLCHLERQQNGARKNSNISLCFYYIFAHES